MSEGGEVPSESPPAGELPRRLGLVSATALVISEMIGVGIFLTPAEMAKSLGSPLLVFLAWASMGLIAACGALCFGSLAARFPEDGGGYVYLKRAYGPRVAFLFGWMSLLVTDPGLTALMAAGLAKSAASIWPLTPLGTSLVAVVAILLIAGANIVGVEVGAGLLRGLSILKLALLGAIAAWGFGSGLGSWSHFTPMAARAPGSDPLVPALIGGFMAAFFTMAGWWDASKITGEVRDPARTMPRALILGVGLVSVAYLLIAAAFWYLVPLSEVDKDRGFAGQVGTVLLGRSGGKVFEGIVILSVFGSLAGILMAAPRVYFAMARDGLFPSPLAAIHPRFGTPARATAIQAVVASVLAASGTFRGILSYFMAVTIAFLALMVAVVYVAPDKSGRNRVPGHPFTPLGFLVPVALVVVLAVASDPLAAGIGFGIVILGLPAYEVFRLGGKKSRESFSEGPI